MKPTTNNLDVFALQPFGQAALKKLAKSGPLPENFRLYAASVNYADSFMDKTTGLSLVGAEFRVAKSGPNAGTLTKMVSGTHRRVTVSNAEITRASIIKLPAKVLNAMKAMEAMDAMKSDRPKKASKP